MTCTAAKVLKCLPFDWGCWAVVTINNLSIWITVQKWQGPVCSLCIPSRLLSPRIAKLCIFLWMSGIFYPQNLLYIIAEVAGLPKIPGAVNEHRGSDQWLAFFLKLIWGLLIGTMAVLDGLFSTPTWANPLLSFPNDIIKYSNMYTQQRPIFPPFWMALIYTILNSHNLTLYSVPFA